MTIAHAAMDIAAAAQLACLLEVNAPKPGNVSPSEAFDDTTYEHFLASAAAIGAPLGAAGTRPLGQTIHLAIQATRRWTTSNTNLGIVLLLAPLARAAATCARGPEAPSPVVIPPHDLCAAVRDVLAATTVDDAREAYAAIRLAAPGGLGVVESQDVASEPTVPLTDAMRLAADRDDVAREYATDFDTTFQVGVPALARARRDGLGWSDAVVETFLTLLAARADTHIARRGGTALAADVTRQARAALDAGGVRSSTGRAAVAAMRASLRERGNLANPGTTADIVTAVIFVTLLGGGWHSMSGGLDAAPR